MSNLISNNQLADLIIESFDQTLNENLDENLRILKDGSLTREEAQEQMFIAGHVITAVDIIKVLEGHR